jgi:hypothetical protein
MALKTLGKPEPWSSDIKVTDDFLDPLFKVFSEKLSCPLVLRKNEYYKLAQFVPKERVHPEITDKLNAIGEVVSKAKVVGA